MATKDELQAEIDDLARRLTIACEDYDAAIDSLHKLENRPILVKVKRDGVVIDAVVVPASGRMSSPITVDTMNPEDYVELWTEPVE